jgi:predicted N-acetyltransferase YhbS
MNITTMTVEDIAEVLHLYLDYYNNCEGGCWTEETARKRIHQVLTMEGGYSLIMRQESGEAIGFAMGYWKQYDDIVGYTLEEIIISRQFQNQGLGSVLLAEIERQVKEQGASCIELQAVNDEMHERYYGKAGYHNAQNFVMKVKWLT